ncbi:hypothetical protein [Solidesulfovibrio sp.]|uniref:hypothetical protein n=1 Tax=Solidesulfovibrio sp. TaxID=2910990 RepID=UPI0026238856|nr:hypothetical protein [Solidesulfovibrio sp.]
MTAPASRRDTLAATLVVLAASVLLTLVSERIFAGDGLGFDGRTYGAVITRLDEVRSGAVSIGTAVYLRMLPALAVRGAMSAAGVALTIPNVIVAFQVVNILMLTLAAYAVCRCADLAGLSRRGKWLACLGVFCNYAVLKHNFYYPVLLDTASLGFAALFAWLYLAGRTWLLLGAGLAGFFVGPNVGLLAFLLFVPPPDRAHGAPATLPLSLAGGLTALAVGAAWLTLAMTVSPPLPATPVALAFLAGGVYCLARAAGFSPRALTRPALLVRLGLAAGLVALLTALPRLVPGLAAYDWVALFFEYARTVVVNSTMRPGEFLVAHTLYFGPFFLCAACLFAPACRAARGFGPGWLAVLAFGLLQSLNPLSRQMIGLLPFLVLPTCLVLDRLPLPAWFPWALAGLSLAVSKVWRFINAGADLSRPMESQPEVWGRYLESTGAWMLDADYRRQGVAVLVLFVLTVAFLVLVRRKQA